MWNSRAISSATRAGVHRWSSPNPCTAGPLPQGLGQPSLSPLIQPAGRPRRRPSRPMPQGHRHAIGAATRTPRWSTPAAGRRSRRPARPRRTTRPPATAPPRVRPFPARSGRLHPRTPIHPRVDHESITIGDNTPSQPRSTPAFQDLYVATNDRTRRIADRSASPLVSMKPVAPADVAHLWTVM